MCKKQTKLNMTVLFVMIVALFISDGAWGIVGDVWNAKTDWSDVSNPNIRTSPPYGTWSYRLSNGDLMVKAFESCGGSPEDWCSSLGGCPNLFNDNWTPGGSHYSSEFAGHGPWMVRWKSPVNGYIKLSGSLWQKFEISRQMACYLILNGDEILAYYYIPQDVLGNTVLGRLGMISFDSIFCSVSVDDTIDLIVDGSGPGGDGISTFAVATFTIEQVEEPPIPLPPASISGDIDRNDCVDFNDLAILANRWLDQDCNYPRWCEGADIDESNDIDFLDFAFIGNNWNQCYIEPLHNLGFLIISPGGPWDGGDFGPSTPGTTTSGWQEAIDYAIENNRDIYVFGGGMPSVFLPPVMYNLNSTLYIPSAENLRIVGGDYLLNFSNTNTDCIVLDSQKNCEFDLGCIAAGNIEDGSSIIKVKPQTARPDGQIGFSNCHFLVNFFVGSGSVWGGGVIGHGTAWLFDGSLGPIENNHFVTMEINACDTGFLLQQGDIRNNIFECPFDHITNNMLVVNAGTFNRFNILLDPGGVGGTVTGANLIGGHDNIYTLVWSDFSTENALVFGPDARDNIVYAMGLPKNYITNNATVPTNKVIPLKPLGLGISTPSFPPSGDDFQNRSSYRIIATITSEGVVSSWTLIDAEGQSQTVNAGLYTGQLIYLEPGEKVNFTYTGSPSWQWQVLR